MKYKPGDQIQCNSNKNIVMVVLACWMLKDEMNEPIAWYYICSFNIQHTYTPFDIGQFIKTFGQWVSETGLEGVIKNV